jgi:phosphohistidine swiveling domain-containing protein
MDIKKQFIILIGFLLILTESNAQIPSKPFAGKILIEHGVLHVGNGQVIDDSYVCIENGKISLVKNALAHTIDKKQYDTIINAKGQHIYPGFFAPNSTLGLTEIDAVRATLDFYEVGDYNPHVRSLIAFNVESSIISTVRTNGVLLTQATPRGGVISGSSSLFHLDGWNWSDAVVAKDDGVHLNWPSFIHKRWREIKQNEKYSDELRELKEFFKLAKVYAENTDKNKNLDIRLQGMSNLFSGNQRLYIHANHIQELLDIIAFAKEIGIQFPVIVGGYDSYLLTNQLRDAKIPVMLGRVHDLPQGESDDIHLPYKLPSLLQKGGVLFCLQNEGDMEAMNARNIPFLAGTARTYGLTNEQAIASITLNAAKIMGIDKQFGSIEEGKIATLFISKGDALDMMTNQVTTAFVHGQFIDLSNRQQQLYEKYKDK